MDLKNVKNREELKELLESEEFLSPKARDKLFDHYITEEPMATSIGRAPKLTRFEAVEAIKVEAVEHRAIRKTRIRRETMKTGKSFWEIRYVWRDSKGRFAKKP